MKRKDLIAKLASSAGVSRETAADRLDDVVADLLNRLRRGEKAVLNEPTRKVQQKAAAINARRRS